MITVDFFLGGGRFVFLTKRHIIIIVVMGARLAKMEAPLDGGGDASLLPPAARAGMVRRRFDYNLRVGRPFFLSISHPLECKCFHRVETDIAFSLSLFVVVIVVVSFVKRVSRGVVSLTTRSLSSLSISPPYRIARAHANRNRRPAATRRRRTKGPKRTSKTFPCRANTKTCKRKC